MLLQTLMTRQLQKPDTERLSCCVYLMHCNSDIFPLSSWPAHDTLLRITPCNLPHPLLLREYTIQATVTAASATVTDASTTGCARPPSGSLSGRTIPLEAASVTLPPAHTNRRSFCGEHLQAMPTPCAVLCRPLLHSPSCPTHTQVQIKAALCEGSPGAAASPSAAAGAAGTGDEARGGAGVACAASGCTMCCSTKPHSCPSFCNTPAHHAVPSQLPDVNSRRRHRARQLLDIEPPDILTASGEGFRWDGHEAYRM